MHHVMCCSSKVYYVAIMTLYYTDRSMEDAGLFRERFKLLFAAMMIKRHADHVF